MTLMLSSAKTLAPRMAVTLGMTPATTLALTITRTLEHKSVMTPVLDTARLVTHHGLNEDLASYVADPCVNNLLASANNQAANRAC